MDELRQKVPWPTTAVLGRVQSHMAFTSKDADTAEHVSTSLCTQTPHRHTAKTKILQQNIVYLGTTHSKFAQQPRMSQCAVCKVPAVLSACLICPVQQSMYCLYCLNCLNYTILYCTVLHYMCMCKPITSIIPFVHPRPSLFLPFVLFAPINPNQPPIVSPQLVLIPAKQPPPHTKITLSCTPHKTAPPVPSPVRREPSSPPSTSSLSSQTVSIPPPITPNPVTSPPHPPPPSTPACDIFNQPTYLPVPVTIPSHPSTDSPTPATHHGHLPFCPSITASPSPLRSGAHPISPPRSVPITSLTSLEEQLVPRGPIARAPLPILEPRRAGSGAVPPHLDGRGAGAEHRQQMPTGCGGGGGGGCPA